MIVCVAIATGLGLWQYDAWQTRRDDAARDLSAEHPRDLGEVMTGDSPFPGRSLGRPVTFHGTWVGDNTYISGRYLDGKRGYWVVSVIRVDGSASAMPVVRGWTTSTGLSTASGSATVIGSLQATEGSGPLDEDPHDDVIPVMRTASLVEKYDVDLYSGYVVATEVSTGSSGGEDLRLATPAAVPGVSWSTGLRNLLYAIEWWVFGGFALLVWLRWCRDSLDPPAELPDGEES